MTNLEWLNEIGMITTNRVAPYGKTIGVNLVIALRDDDFKKYSEKGFDWLLEEHKEPIKLKQWEKDLLETLQCEEVKFCCHELLLEMRYKGHFKGISDIGMNLREILGNCKVVE